MTRYLHFPIGFCGLFALLLLPGSLRASDARLETILQRIEALEQENAVLREAVHALEEKVGSCAEASAMADASAEHVPHPHHEDHHGHLHQADEGDEDLEELFADASPPRLRPFETSLNILAAAGISSEKGETLETLQGGAHDPGRRGFTLQQTEFSIFGGVDPYFRGEGHIVATADEIELEEAFFQTLSLPYGLELEGGFFFTEFGRHNPLHPDGWTWLDQPFVNTRIFGGEAMRGVGLRLAKDLPLPWTSTLHAGVQNADGEFMASFRGGEVAEETSLANLPETEQEVEDLADLVWLARWENRFDLGHLWQGGLGLSALFGPNFTGEDGDTRIFGADFGLTRSWSCQGAGTHFLRFEGEFVYRDFDVDDHIAGEGISGSLEDWGTYAQALFGCAETWEAGLRLEYASGDGDSFHLARDLDPFRNDRWRLAPLILYRPSHFSRVRLQYNYDEPDHLDDPAHSLWLGMEVSLGVHHSHN